MIFELNTFDLLTFYPSVTSNRKIGVASNSLGYSQSISSNQKRGIASNLLGMVQYVAHRFAVGNVSCSNTLSFSHTARNTKILTASNHLAFYHNVTRLKVNCGNTLTFNQTVVPVFSNGAANRLGFGHSVTVVKSLNIYVEQQLSFGSFANALMCEVCGVIGSYTIGQADLTLTYGQNVLILRNPNFGDEESIDYNRIVHRSRGGDLLITTLDNWKVRVFNYSFSGFKQTDVDKLKGFMKDSLGLTINMKDHNNNQYNALILNPETAFEQVGRNNFNVNLEIEVVPI